MQLHGNSFVEITKNEISEYLSTYNKNNISISKIKEDLKNIIGFTPAVNVTWSKNEVLNEKTNLKEIKEEASKITISFVDNSTGNLTPYNIDFIL